MNNENSNPEKKIETKWEFMQRIGKNKYILFYGIVMYGITLFVAYHLTLLISNMFTDDNFSFIAYMSDTNNHIRFASSFILFALMGLYLSSSTWKKHEKRHNEEN